MKAQFISKMMPADMVTFDFNPEQLTVSRSASSNSNPSPSGPKGATPSIFRGAQPASLKWTRGLEGSDGKGRANRYSMVRTRWGNAGQGGGAAMGALTGAGHDLAAKLPCSSSVGGPFLMECVRTRSRSATNGSTHRASPREPKFR